MTFRIHPLPAAPFRRFFTMSDADLARHRARIEIVETCPGIPCRVSLADAAPGERVLLVNHVHLDVDTPFRAAHAIYVREAAAPWQGAPGMLPPALGLRPISLRGIDDRGLMRDAALAEGPAVARGIAAMLDAPGIAEVHLHYAAPGCYAARATRVRA